MEGLDWDWDDHLGAPFSTTLNIINPVLDSSPSFTVTCMPWGMGEPWLSSNRLSNLTSISRDEGFHAKNSGSELEISKLNNGVSASESSPTTDNPSQWSATFTVGTPSISHIAVPKNSGREFCRVECLLRG